MVSIIVLSQQITNIFQIADENGKWWVVGSAWSGKTNTAEPEQKPTKSVTGFSQKILELAKSQKMNTDLRRNIFCVIMSAEVRNVLWFKLQNLNITF